jgi:hypothetical protein
MEGNSGIIIGACAECPMQERRQTVFVQRVHLSAAFEQQLDQRKFAAAHGIV